MREIDLAKGRRFSEALAREQIANIGEPEIIRTSFSAFRDTRESLPIIIMMPLRLAKVTGTFQF